MLISRVNIAQQGCLVVRQNVTPISLGRPEILKLNSLAEISKKGFSTEGIVHIFLDPQ